MSEPDVAPPGEEISFEDALARLEAIVQRLDRGDLALEAALTAFEEGVALTRRCSERLEKAERRIALIVREGAGVVARPFDPGPASDEAAAGGSQEDAT